MKKHDWSIKETLTELIEEAPSSPSGKNETWNRIHEEMSGKRSEVRPRRRVLYIAASILIITFALVSISPQRVSASFGWITKLIVQIQGTLTQLVGTTSSSGNEPPVPAINISTNEVKLEKLTVEEARLITTFGIVVPKYIPEGYAFSGIYVQVVESKKSSHVLIKYNNDEGDTLEIRETDTNDQRGYSIGIDNDDTEIVDINVPGISGSILTFKNGSKKAVINKQNIQIVIDSDLSNEELREIAKSLL